MGRSALGQTTVKHQIKRIDRLLSNPRLYRELSIFCKAMIHMLIKPRSTPVILVDWTRINEKQCALFASTPYEGRSITLYFEVCPLNKLANRSLERNFLKTLKEILPKDVIPTIVTDAGYLNPWFQEVIKLGWYFVGRLGPHIMITKQNQTSHKLVTLEHSAKTKPIDWGVCKVTNTNPTYYRIIQGAKFERSTKRSPNPRPYKHAGRGGAQSRKRSQLPWILGTNHLDLKPQQVIDIYHLRMQIEELFRDFKNMRFGWSLKEARCSSSQRYSVLLLIASIAHFITMMIGIIAEKRKLHLHFQTNSITHRRVLSLFFLGKEIIRLNCQFKVTMRELIQAIKLAKHSIIIV